MAEAVIQARIRNSDEEIENSWSGNDVSAESTPASEEALNPDLIRMVRNQLRPPTSNPYPPPDAHGSRLELSEAITHRPQPRGGGLEL